ncbi:hypothetical protein B0O80DRAFT_493478 [Mortierella sp. GBAus27b]|nr:hypothetical protein B0O80DRAFT_493478 [Mortierella sp. GBAus27b]
MPTSVSAAQVVLGAVSVLAGIGLQLALLQSTPEYIQPRTDKCLLPTLAPEDDLLPIPGLNRLVCILVPYFVDCSKTDYGQLVLQSLMAFFCSIMLLIMVEAGRLGNRWSLLSFMPFTALFAYSTGIGIYLPIFFVPLMIKGRSRVMSTPAASHVPLARMYAILVTHGLDMINLNFMFSSEPTRVGEGNSWIPQSVAVNVVLTISMWFIYTPLTWVFGMVVGSESKEGARMGRQETKARQLVRDTFVVMAGLNTGLHYASLINFWHGSTPFQVIIDSFSHQVRVDQIYNAPAFFLFLDFLGASSFRQDQLSCGMHPVASSG